MPAHNSTKTNSIRRHRQRVMDCIKRVKRILGPNFTFHPTKSGLYFAKPQGAVCRRKYRATLHMLKKQEAETRKAGPRIKHLEAKGILLEWLTRFRPMNLKAFRAKLHKALDITFEAATRLSLLVV